VFGTLHTNSAAESIDRMVGVFPSEMQEQVRTQLSNSLVAIVSQQLLPKVGGGRIAAVES
jgi:twitching motility protein PilT